MKILIVDDEPLALSRLERLLRGLGESDIESVMDASCALKACARYEYDVVFLDITLADTLGTKLAIDMLSKNKELSIVFQTAHENYALKAFEVGAIDYLLKPYSKEQVKATLERLRKLKGQKPPFFMIKDGSEYVTVFADDIYYIEAELSQSIIRTKEVFLYYPKKISQIEELLASHGFFRIHRSIIVNTLKIKKISTVEQSRLMFCFNGIDEVVESSKDGAKLFRQRFGD